MCKNVRGMDNIYDIIYSWYGKVLKCYLLAGWYPIHYKIKKLRYLNELVMLVMILFGVIDILMLTHLILLG